MNKTLKIFQLNYSKLAYIDSLLKKHGLDANPVSTPLVPNAKLDLDPNEPNDPETKGDLTERSSSGDAKIETNQYLLEMISVPHESPEWNEFRSWSVSHYIDSVHHNNQEFGTL